MSALLHNFSLSAILSLPLFYCELLSITILSKLMMMMMMMIFLPKISKLVEI